MSKEKKSKHPFKGMGVNLGTRSISEFPHAPSNDPKVGLAIYDSTGKCYTEADLQKLHQSMQRLLIPVPDVSCSIPLRGDRHVGLTMAGNELVFIQRHGKADAHLDQYVNTRYRTKGEARRLIEYIEHLMVHLPE